jgi:flagellar protein FlaG
METITANPVHIPTVSVSPMHIQRSVAQSSEAPVQNIEAPTLQQDTKNDNISLQNQKKILQESTKKFNEMSDTLNLDIKFAYNDKIDQVYLNVIEKNTGRVIRKLPSEEAMKISESMKELVGNLLDKKG